MINKNIQNNSYMLHSHLNSFNLEKQRIFVRADLNVPLEKGHIKNDFRLQEIRPTLDLILKKKGKIILATHLGRPDGYDANLSTYHLVSWFAQHNYQIDFAENPDEAAIKSYEKPHHIVLLENLRFFKGEQESDDRFARLLAACADYYVNDAFGMLHRTETSITLLPKLFASTKRTIGLLIEKELKELNKIRYNPQRPFVVMLGGAKIKTKLPLIKKLLLRADTILLCPPLVFTFLKAQGKETGKSLTDEKYIDEAKNIIALAEQNNAALIFPTDYQVAEPTKNGSLSIKTIDEFMPSTFGIAIGPKSIEKYKEYLASAQTIFFNGFMGFLDRPETLQASKELVNVMQKSNAYTVIGGGDTVAAVQKLNLGHGINFLSSGGGATLSYIAGEQLPGLNIFEENNAQ
ncbi:MAG: phosphoglycerate kinase [Candidatus Babeliales bacterium]